MAIFRTNREINEQLDEAGRHILRSAALTQAESDAAASAPFLFARVRAAIAAQNRDEAGSWLSVLFVARHAVPAMALIAVLTAILTVFSSSLGAPATQARSDYEPLFEPRDQEVQMILANRNGLSGDEVFGIVVERNNSEQR
jgi:hypothetical protein